MIGPITKRNYLNNKDILKEIHKSKSTYCWFEQKSDADYDFIIRDLADIPATLLPSMRTEQDENGNDVEVEYPAEAKVARAKRLVVAAQDAALLEGKKIKADDVGISHEDIADTDVIYRMMTWDHIPEAAPVAPKIKKGKKAQIIQEEEDLLVTEYDEPEPAMPTKYVKVNFPPFAHYRLNAEGELVCIGRSHWKGDLATGHFSKDHGKTTNKLALMYMKLCERYATRSNWRGYTYNDEMRSQALLQLSQIGLQFDESKSANPFAYYTAAITNSFTRVLNIEKRNQNIRDDILEMNNLTPSYTRQGSGGGDHGHGADE